MSSSRLESVALALVAEGKGILAADETVPALTKRFRTLGIQSTEQSRRTYREVLFTCPDAAEGPLPPGQSQRSRKCREVHSEMEAATADYTPHRRDWRDD